MAYTKNTWADGDVVTSEKLNHMEDGIADAGGIMIINDTDNTLDKTWQEISDAMAANTFCVIKTVLQGIDGSSVCNYLVVEAGYSELNGTSPYYLSVIIKGSTVQYVQYTTTSATGYPRKESFG